MMRFIRNLRTVRLIAAAALFLSTLASASAAEVARSVGKPIPVIFDSDIGDDIDDTWALGLLLRCPELDVKLVVGDYGKVQYRAKLLAKFLEAANRTDIPVGLGIDIDPRGGGPQDKWVQDYRLESYPGRVHKDGVQAMIDLIMQSQEPITLLAIGPLPNVAEALKREPRIAERARFVGMHGSVRLGYGGSTNIAAEWNVKAAPQACQAAFKAAWPMTITPLDTCGLVSLHGDQYARVRDSQDPIAAAIMANYRFWSTHGKPDNRTADRQSSILFDAVAVYLAFAQDLCNMETLPLKVTDKGFTLLDDNAKRMEVATSWKDLNAFRELLVKRLTTDPR